jgi:uncharacterized protein (TIGR00369 family)
MSGEDLLATLRAVNAQAGFNRWAGLVVSRAEPGEVELRLSWRDEFGQYNGFLHAGVIGALIDTACGFAAYTTAGPVLASHFSVNCLAPARGAQFVAVGRIVKAGRKQIFTVAELFAATQDPPSLVASGQAILVPIADHRP